MRIGIIVDSSIDLPKSFYEQENITILPVTVKIGDASLADDRDEAAALAFLSGETGARAAEADTTPFTARQIHELFLSRLVLDYDYVFCITMAASRSAIHENAVQASYSILNEYKPVRAAAGNNTPFALRVVDTQNVFAACGVLPVEAARLRSAGEGAPKIRARLEYLALHTHGYMVPPDLIYLRNRIKRRGDKSVSFLSATLGTALDIKPVLHCNRGETGPVAKIKGFDNAVQRTLAFAAQRVRAGLLTPTLCLSSGGELEAMRALPGYEDLRATCASQNVELFESVMSVTGMVNVGKGALVVGFAAEAPRFDG